MSEFDAFGDIVQKEVGIFGGGGGLEAHDSLNTTATPTGVKVMGSCRSCGKPEQVEVEYGELIGVKYNVAPDVAFRNTPFVKDLSPWGYSNVTNGWFPVVKCNHCRELLPMHFTTAEAEKHLATARVNRWINPLFERDAAMRADQVAKSSQYQQIARR